MMLYTIHIHNVQKRISAPPDLFRKQIHQMLKSQGVLKADLSVVITTDRGIRAINKKFLDHDYATDVVTFDLSAGEMSRQKRARIKEIEGEVYVSAVTAARQARVYGLLPHDELLLYITHGILHLLGYDDHTTPDRKTMRRKEKEILNSVLADRQIC